MLVRALFILLFSSIGSSLRTANDPCKAIAKKKWVSPAQARACLSSFPLTAAMRANTIQVLNKTLAFHSSLNYQISAPRPYQDTQVDLVAELDRIDKEYYCSEFEFHLDVYRTFLRANDGHLGYSNYCYDDAFTSYLPLPLVLLTDEKTGAQNVHIAPISVFRKLLVRLSRLVWACWLVGKLTRTASLTSSQVLARSSNP